MYRKTTILQLYIFMMHDDQCFPMLHDWLRSYNNENCFPSYLLFQHWCSGPLWPNTCYSRPEAWGLRPAIDSDHSPFKVPFSRYLWRSVILSNHTVWFCRALLSRMGPMVKAFSVSAPSCKGVVV